MKALLVLFTLFAVLFANFDENEKKDDWDYNATIPVMEYKKAGMSMPSTVSMEMPSPRVMQMKTLGFSVGGAKDADNFYENIKKGYLPKINSITYEGVFYDHYFDIKKQKCNELFCPSYESAVRKNPYSDKKEYFVSVGLNSNLDMSRFKRPPLNLVVVLDISGSMGSAFNKYYYDKGVKKESDQSKTKMQIANEVLASMIDHLKAEDSLAIVLFDNNAYLAKPARKIKYTDTKAIKKHILELKPRGGTNWSAGYKKGLEIFDSLEKDKSRENRIIFITDAMPNQGELRKDRLFGMVKDASQDKIYTSFIGVGVDFNNNLVEYISKTKGANYFSVHSAKEFKKRLDSEFDYLVTPLVFDLSLKLSSNDFVIDKVYGAPKANLHTGEVLKVDTLFPSSSSDEGVKGGVILVKLKKIGSGDEFSLKVNYKDRDGKSFSSYKSGRFESGNYFEGSGIKKAVMLSDFVTLMKNFLVDNRKNCNDKVAFPPYQILKQKCMIYPPLPPQNISTWERRSCKLKVSEGYKKLFSLFYKNFDKSLKKESEILRILIGKGKTESKHTILDDWNFVGE